MHQGSLYVLLGGYCTPYCENAPPYKAYVGLELHYCHYVQLFHITNFAQALAHARRTMSHIPLVFNTKKLVVIITATLLLTF